MDKIDWEWAINDYIRRNLKLEQRYGDDGSSTISLELTQPDGNKITLSWVCVD